MGKLLLVTGILLAMAPLVLSIMARPEHRLVPHTADVEIHVRASSLPELFAEAGRALADLIGEAETTTDAPFEEVNLEASDREALLVDWLNELIYRSEIQQRIYRELEVELPAPAGLRARIRGCELRAFKTHVKAATFHRLQITEDDCGWFAAIVLDV